MTFRDPFAAYNAASNVEAHLVCAALVDAGIPARVIEDVSQVGVWIGGFVSEIHKPQVWIERADADRAKPVLDEYEQLAAERRAPAKTNDDPVPVTCEECGTSATFPAAQRGSVQHCPHCRAYVDVGETDIEGWDAVPGEDDEPADG